MADASSSRLPCALYNGERYCYVNAVLQALYACEKFRDDLLQTVGHFYENKLHHTTKTMKALASIFHIMELRAPDLYHKGSFIFDPMPLLLRANPINTTEPQDAEEFMCFLLQEINNERYEACCLLNVSSDQCNSASGFLTGSLTTITEKGLEAGAETRSSSIDPFLTLRLNVEHRNLKHALKRFFAVNESNVDDAENCVLEVIRIAELPRVLIIQLKIFKHEVCSSKIFLDWKLDETLTIPAEFIDFTSGKQKLRAPRTYSLQAVISHIGPTIDTGHYICDSRHSAVDPLTWYRFNDADVTPITLDEVLNEAPEYVDHDDYRPVPYVLFYVISPDANRSLGDGQ